MKKWLLVLISVVVLLLLGVYLVIPRKLTISTFVFVKANVHGAYRCLTDEDKWRKIFGNGPSGNSFHYHDVNFTIHKRLADRVEVLIEKNGIFDSSLIELSGINQDSCVIRWGTFIGTSSNPLSKVQQYFSAFRLKNDMSAALDTIKRFLEKEQNIYEIDVSRTIVKDTLLIVTRNTFKNYPSTADIYGLIQHLQAYAAINNATQSGYPMLDIKTSDSSNFQAMVALPVNKDLEDAGAILHKQMIPGNILVTEVKGGPYIVSKAFNNLRHYVFDHDLQSPAIPFQSLITDRSKEPDTTKWITKIYYPIY